PPDVLYHGTGHTTADAILRTGLSRMRRHHVHLSATVETATAVGGRHGRPVVLVVDAAALRQAGIGFYRSANGVWWVDSVPPEYLRLLCPPEESFRHDHAAAPRGRAGLQRRPRPPEPLRAACPAHLHADPGGAGEER